MKTKHIADRTGWNAIPDDRPVASVQQWKAAPAHNDGRGMPTEHLSDQRFFGEGQRDTTGEGPGDHVYSPPEAPAVGDGDPSYD